MSIVVDQVSYQPAGGGPFLLENVSFSLKEGSLTTLLGPNGAGKTTLLKLLLRLIQPSSGTITFSSQTTLGYMPQKIELNSFLPLTVQGFLSLAPRPLRCPQDALEQVGAIKLTSRALLKLSGGELQRVLLARALMQCPSMLILDEPTQGLDVKGQADFYEILLTLRKRQGCTILLVSHDLHTVLEESDHVICLNRHVCCEGTPQDVQHAPTYANLFPGFSLKPKHRFYAHHHDHLHS